MPLCLGLEILMKLTLESRLEGWLFEGYLKGGAVKGWEGKCKPGRERRV
jgi:hypothetical protein